MSKGAKSIPRFLMTYAEVVLSFASRRTLVDELRAEKILVGKRFKKSLVFSVQHVQKVAENWLAGEYDELLIKKDNAKR